MSFAAGRAGSCRPTWYRGRDAVAAFLRRWPLAGDLRSRLIPTSANGQLAFGHYTRGGETGNYLAHGVQVLTLRGDEIETMTVFLTPEALATFGLPDEIAAG